MFNSSGGGGSPVRGVRTPESQMRETATPKTIMQMAEGRMFAVEFGDESGQKHVTTVFVVGNQVYFPLDAEKWTSALRPAASWFAKEALRRIAEQNHTTVSDEDSVDVIDTPTKPRVAQRILDETAKRQQESCE